MSAEAKLQAAVDEAVAELLAAARDLREIRPYAHAYPRATNERLRECARLRGKLQGLRQALALVRSE